MKILYAVSPWGMGHATRSSVILSELIRRGHLLEIASAGRSADFLRRNFPSIQNREIEHRPVHYSSHQLKTSWITIRAAWQLHNEARQWIQKQKGSRYDVLVSDGWLGMYIPEATNIFVNHQVRPQVLHPILGKVANLQFDQWMRYYEHLWIPDFEDRPQSLAGRLSFSTDTRATYIGPLSHLISGEKLDRSTYEPKSYKLLILLSGPEPSRSLLEQKMVHFIREFRCQDALIVRGTSIPSSQSNPDFDGVDLVDSETLAHLIHTSDKIVARAGYSTIMDLHQLGRKAILIPTPGQKEQEYLARHLSAEQGFIEVREDSSFEESLARAIPLLPATSSTRQADHSMLQTALDRLQF